MSTLMLLGLVLSWGLTVISTLVAISCLLGYIVEWRQYKKGNKPSFNGWVWIVWFAAFTGAAAAHALVITSYNTMFRLLY